MRIQPGSSFTRFFEQPGTVIYYSVEFGNPNGLGMTGRIVVEPVAATPVPSEEDTTSPGTLPASGGNPTPLL
ncbi:MAG: hypothetical protein M3220_08435, partial [Chloroflexota bacterium]|nr:hypothetical protein [Chloroflexota bacterium]